jgi:aquaporin Z
MTPAVLVEFLGTALLISAVAFGTPLMSVAALAIAISFGGSVSGGHFNPAVTVFQLFSGRVSQSKALMYVGAQLAAAFSVGVLHSIL